MTVVLQSPIMAPHKCCMCGASSTHDGRKYVDTGIDIEFYGVVYYCSICFAETAKKLNFVYKEELDEARRIVQEQTVQINQLVSRIEEMQNDLNHYKRMFSLVTPSTVAPVDTESSESSNSPITSLGTESGGKQAVIKSSTKPRPKNV